MTAVLHSAPRFASNAGVRDALCAALGEPVLSSKEENGEIVLTVRRDSIEDVLRTLRDEHDYQQLMEIAGVDYPQRPERFDVVYMLLSLTKNHRIMVKVTTDEATPVPTVTTLWPVAGWLEREVFDMFGVLFAGHSDLRRILTDYGFQGHPFRKDFPLTGYVEMRYSDEAKRVVYEPVQLAQDFRSFDFMSPWEGADYVLPGDEKADPVPAAAPGPAATKPETGGPSPAQSERYVKGSGKPGDAGAGPAADQAAVKQIAPSADAPSNVAGQGQGQPVPKTSTSEAAAAPDATSSRPARKPRKSAAKPQSSPEGS